MAVRLPNPFRKGEGQVGAQVRQLEHRNRRSRDGSTESSLGRVNWGTSVRYRAVGINKKLAVTGRSSDVAIVSDEASGQ